MDKNSVKETIKIAYRFSLNNGKKANFSFEFDKKTMALIPIVKEQLPSWTDLEFEQCSNCPLNKTTHPQCPAAANLVGTIDHFDDIVSYEEIDLEVQLPDRSIRQRTSAQSAICSLFGLLISSSGCPHTAFFKVMARHHLPLANHQETVCRATSMYLLAQYVLNQKGEETEYGLGGLQKIYENIQIVNRSIVNRLRSAVKTDATLNAVVMLDGYAQSLPMVIEEAMEEIHDVFQPFLDQLDSNN